MQSVISQVIILLYRIRGVISRVWDRIRRWPPVAAISTWVENSLWNSSRAEKKEKPAGIFLHSLFRSGSTYLFNTFRSRKGYWCYYEPLHHQLVQIREGRLDVFSFSREATGNMGHPDLHRPHFQEFSVVLRKGRVPLYNPGMAYREFARVKQHARLFKYILMLLENAPEGTIPLLQLNRSSLRIGWFRKYFPNSLHLYLLRNNRDQFESYYRMKKGHKYNIFLAVNLYVVAVNRDYGKFAEAYAQYRDRYRPSANFYRDMALLGGLSGEIDPAVHYLVFLHLWITSLIEADKHADAILDMNRLSDSPSYRSSFVSMLRERIDVDPQMFDDSRIREYDRYSLDEQTMLQVEDGVAAAYGDELAAMEYEIPFNFGTTGFGRSEGRRT
ncbi:MAG: hypothetical protein Kow0089_19890 [Desulfobulbaceae bacterium]